MFVVVGICAAVFIYSGVPWIYGRLSRLCLSSKLFKQNAVILTFDDGPGGRLTPKLLDLLAEYGVRASFFLLGRNIDGREKIVKRIIDEGHEVCSHGYGHLHYLKVSPLRALKDIKAGWKAIDSALGANNKAYSFRPPGGKLNIVCLLYLLIRRVPIVYWTFVSGDTYDSQEREKRLSSLDFIKPAGEVVLIHDFDRSDQGVEQMILGWVRSLLDSCKENSVKVLTVSEVLAA